VAVHTHVLHLNATSRAEGHGAVTRRYWLKQNFDVLEEDADKDQSKALDQWAKRLSGGTPMTTESIAKLLSVLPDDAYPEWQLWQKDIRYIMKKHRGGTT